MKKFISLFLTICLITSICAFMPLTASAATSGTCGDNLTWTLDDNGTLTISGTGTMEYFYNYSDVPWNDLATSIVKAIIGNGVTNISDYALGMCTNLIDVSISESVTDIGLETFGKCSKLETIVVDADNKEYSSIDGIVYSKDKTSLWVYPAGKQETMFAIPESVKSIEFAAFKGCQNIASVVLPNSVTYIGNYSFYKCINLESITIPKSVSWIGMGAFHECPKLKDVYFTGSEQQWDVVFDETKSNGTYIDTDNECIKNAEIHYNYTEITNNLVASGTCGDNLTWTLDDEGTLTISGTGDMWDYDINYHYTPWYEKRAQITNVNICSGVSSIGDFAFQGFEKLTNITIPYGIVSIGRSSFNITGLKQIVLPSTVRHIDSYAFSYSRNLTDITIPSSVTSIWDNTVFAGCSNLTIKGYVGSKAEKHANDNNITFQALTPIAQGNCGENVTWVLDPDGFLILDGSGKMYDGSPWSDYKSQIKTIILNYGITNIGQNAFNGCSELTAIFDSIPNSVVSIGKGAFSNCSSLKNVTYCPPKINIEDEAFTNCHSLKEISIGYNAVLGKNAFKNCNKLTTLSLGNNVTLGEGSFSDCSSLNNIVIPDSIQVLPKSLFSNCTSLCNITLHDFITNIGENAFYNCTALENVKFIGLEEELNNICIGNGNDLLLNTDISYLCKGKCGDNATWSLNRKTGKLSIDGYGKMYDNDVIEGKNGYVSQAPWLLPIKGNEYITSVDVASGITSIGNDSFLKAANLQSVTLPSTIEKIGERAFNGCTVLSELSLPQNVKTIGESAFAGCKNIESICIPSEVTNIEENTFNGCKKLKTISLPDNLNSIGEYTFASCTSLRYVSLPSALTMIGEYAFYNCTNLSYVNIPCKITEINKYTFYGCENLLTVDIEGNVVDIDDCAFEACKNLKNFDIPESVIRIGEGAFIGCAVLEISIPDNVKNIGSAAFSGCNILNNPLPNGIEEVGLLPFKNLSINTIEIPDSLTKVANFYAGSGYFNSGGYGLFMNSNIETVKIGMGLPWIFPYCNRNSSISTVILPYCNDKSMSAYTYNCDNLTDIYFCGTENEWKEVNGYDSITCTIHYINQITYNGNGGENAPNYQPKYVDKSITISSQEPVRKGYKFIGWSENKESKIATYFPGDVYNINSSMDLYAVWELDEINITDIKLNKSALSLTEGNSETLTATITPDNATNKGITWTSSNTSVATVSNGKVTAKAAGTATITVTTSDGGYTASCTVTVTEKAPATVAVTGVTLNKSAVSLEKDKTETLTATVAPSNATNKNVSWKSSNTGVATVANGVVTAVSAGTAAITVTTADGGYTASCTVTITETTVDTNAPKITITGIKTMPGKEIQVTVDLANNTGFVDLGIEVGYNSEVMTLTGITANSGVGATFTPAQGYTVNPYNFGWSGTSNIAYNGNLATLTFTVAEDAADGIYPITVDYYKGRNGDYTDGEDVNYDENGNAVGFVYISGNVVVASYIPGDINGDEKVNNKDATHLLRYLAGWSLSDITSDALDVDGSGSVNNKDATHILRYLAGWNITLH